MTFKIDIPELPDPPCSGEATRAALREGMCPFGHALEPVPAEMVVGWDKGVRRGICHQCVPCVEWTWPRDRAAALAGQITENSGGWLFSRGFAHYAEPQQVNHS